MMTNLQPTYKSAMRLVYSVTPWRCGAALFCDSGDFTLVLVLVLRVIKLGKGSWREVQLQTLRLYLQCRGTASTSAQQNGSPEKECCVMLKPNHYVLHFLKNELKIPITHTLTHKHSHTHACSHAHWWGFCPSVMVWYCLALHCSSSCCN